MNILKSKRYVRVIIGAMMIMVSLGIKQAQAVPIYATGGDLIVTILPTDAAFTHNLWVSSLSGERYVGSKQSGWPREVNLGRFVPGTELVFKLYVGDTRYGEHYTFFTEPDHRNPDGRRHALVNFIAPGKAYIGFEDLLDRNPATFAWDHAYAGQGEPDYNDFTFYVTNVSSSPPIPTPKPPVPTPKPPVPTPKPSVPTIPTLPTPKPTILTLPTPQPPILTLPTPKPSIPTLPTPQPSIPTNVSPDPDIIPEPSTMCLLGSGLIGLIGYGRKRLFRKDRKV